MQQLFQLPKERELKLRSHSLNPRLQELLLPVGILENFFGRHK